MNKNSNQNRDLNKSQNKKERPPKNKGDSSKKNKPFEAKKSTVLGGEGILNNSPSNKVLQKNTQNNARKNNNSVRGNNNTQREKRQSKSIKPSKGNLKVMFLGGVGEIGKNVTAFEYGDDIVVIDCGMSFPTNNMPGVDVVIPDFEYLCQNKDKIRGLLLTHGHEDHIGSVPFLLTKLGKKLNIYGTKLTLGLVENKLVEYDVTGLVNFLPIADKSVVQLGCFSAEFIHVSHSVAGSVAIALKTPVGTVLHTGDFKVDYTPLGNEIMNLNRIAEIGRQGVLLLMSESTNAEKPGYTMSESIVKETMNKLFGQAKGRRIIIATFASNVDRLGMIMELARLYKRKIAVSGRSMVKCIETANRVGQIKIDDSLFVDIDKIGSVEDGKLVILSTGSQGEPMSALTRMAEGEFNKVKIGENDTVIISAHPIPGNEKDVYNVINNLYRLGAVVIYSSLADVHVSGHACQEELKLIYTLAKPKYFIPIHGEYRHLKQHSMLVETLGHKKQNVIIPELGDVVEVNKNFFKLNGKVDAGNVMVDGLGIGDVGNIVLKDRLTLAEDGILVAVLGIERSSGNIVSGPEIISRGCFFNGDDNTVQTTTEMKALVVQECAKYDLCSITVSSLKTSIQRVLRHYFKVKFKRNPVVLPIVLDL